MITNSILLQAEELTKPIKHVVFDREKHIIIVPFPKGTTKELVMEKGMLGAWFKDNGFNVSFSYGDYEYETQPTWVNRRGFVREKGHKAFLRNRCIGTFTW
jgi:hypothetical protein